MSTQGKPRRFLVRGANDPVGDESSGRLRWFATPAEITQVVIDAKALCSPGDAELCTRSVATLRIEDELFLAVMCPNRVALRNSRRGLGPPRRG